MRHTQFDTEFMPSNQPKSESGTQEKSHKQDDRFRSPVLWDTTQADYRMS